MDDHHSTETEDINPYDVGVLHGCHWQRRHCLLPSNAEEILVARLPQVVFQCDKSAVASSSSDSFGNCIPTVGLCSQTESSCLVHGRSSESNEYIS